MSAVTLSCGANTRLSQVDATSDNLYLLHNGLGELARTRLTSESRCSGAAEIDREYYHFATDGRALELVQQTSTGCSGTPSSCAD